MNPWFCECQTPEQLWKVQRGKHTQTSLAGELCSGFPHLTSVKWGCEEDWQIQFNHICVSVFLWSRQCSRKRNVFLMMKYQLIHWDVRSVFTIQMYLITASAWVLNLIMWYWLGTSNASFSLLLLVPVVPQTACNSSVVSERRFYQNSARTS